jgi:hypothetical protein
MPQRVRPLIEALADESGRASAAQALADHIGAKRLLLLVKDPELGVMLPAPGMSKTLAAGPSWRDLLRRCLHEHQPAGPVDLEGRAWQAQAQVEGGCAFVLLGDAPCSFPPAVLESLPLVAAVLCA